MTSNKNSKDKTEEQTTDIRNETLKKIFYFIDSGTNKGIDILIPQKELRGFIQKPLKIHYSLITGSLPGAKFSNEGEILHADIKDIPIEKINTFIKALEDHFGYSSREVSYDEFWYILRKSHKKTKR